LTALVDGILNPPRDDVLRTLISREVGFEGAECARRVAP
jgi:hypothetical protein